MEERLQKIIARAGIASRRKAEELILQGRVTVNGVAVRELGSKANPRRDDVRVDDKLLQAEPLVYFALNKPRGVVSAVSDPQGRPVVTDFVRLKRRVYPAGRLDYDSEGLVLLTNDGELAGMVMEAGHLEKVYFVKVSGLPGETELKRLRTGWRFENGDVFGPCQIRLVKPGNNPWFEVVLRQGRNRQIRRMFEAVGHGVMRLRRVSIGPIELGSLKAGEWRRLSEGEIHGLRKELERSGRKEKGT